MNDNQIKEAARLVMSELMPVSPVAVANSALKEIAPQAMPTVSQYADEWLFKNGIISEKRLNSITESVYVSSRHVKDFKMVIYKEQKKISLTIYVSWATLHLFRWRLSTIAKEVFHNVSFWMPEWTIDILIDRCGNNG